ncbi:PaaI family thioesterase [Sandaracinobacter sp.]|uniref:PaaI family thioesterase n=1 Tax=Sandaracinobacter sp. TaxID=2487581 RepID=UPI0035B094A3
MADAAEDGLSQLRARVAGGMQAPLLKKLGMAIVEVERGRVVFEGTPDSSDYNPMDSVHGGYAATLLDSACGMAVQSALPANCGHTTLELKVSYLKALTDRSGKVRATGRIITVGRRVGFSEATLHDAQGRLCATATSTLLVFDMPAEDRKP